MKTKHFLSIFSLLFIFLPVYNSWAQLSITTSGQVGIGTETPNTDSKLHVVHDDYYAGYFTSSKASTSTHVVHAEYKTSSQHGKAFYGVSEMNPGWGYGGVFIAGYRAVCAVANITGAGSRYGIRAVADNGASNNYAISATSSGYAGYFDGDVTVTGTFSNPSDEKLKENLISIKGALNKLIGLDAKSFTYKSTGDYAKMNLPSGTRYGFVAQEFEKIFPNLVQEESHPIDEKVDGEFIEMDHIIYKGINYVELIPILVQAIKEQQQMIEELKNKLNK
jgi:hypothetical protein